MADAVNEYSSPGDLPPAPLSPAECGSSGSSGGSGGGGSRLVALARDIKLSHSLFAMPFALLATFMAADHRGSLPSLATLSLIVVCMVLARTVAMTVNRWADARFDALNPRTAKRAIPSGRLSRRFMLAATLGCAAGFIAATSGFYVLDGNLWPLVLSPLVLAWLVGYSFTKRVTWLCHLFLGVALALSPIAAAIAVAPAFVAEPDVHLLAVMVACWVAGFDIIYALQDVGFDRRVGLHSIPATFGVEPALWISRSLHAVALAALITLALGSQTLGPFFGIGVALVAGLLILEHALVWGSRTHHINVAFFTVNGVISLLLGALGIVDVVLHVR